MTKAKFDREETINSAVELFWKNGFNGSSMQQVTKATGLKPGSIYLAFENKQGLYQEALDLYANKSLEGIQHQIDQAASPGEAICQILQEMVRTASEKTYNSCFLVKSQLELASENSELHAFANQKLQQIEALYAHNLTPEFGEDLANARAASIMFHIFGIRVYGYHKKSPDVLLRALQDGLPWLPWPDHA